MVSTRTQAVSRALSKSNKRHKRRLHVERLEARLLLAADADPFRSLLSHGGICHCPVCAGLAQSDVEPEPVEETSTSSDPVAAGLLVPELSSRPGAPVTLYLDFDGHFQDQWGSWSNITSPAFDRDGNVSSFTDSELTSIRTIWARVAEDYLPFNINVTTVEPPSFDNGVAVRIVISGGWADWYGTQAGGVAYIGSFTNDAPNVAYVFENDLGNGFPKWTAEAVSHEAGHTFGLLHQSLWWANGTLAAEYNTGENDWAPIMGNGNFAQRSTWHNGTTNVSPTDFQDELAILSSVLGYVADDYGDTTGSAAVMQPEGSSVNHTGVIGHNGDVDVFQFTTAGGSVSFSLSVAAVGNNLDSVLELWDANGQVLVVADDPWSYGSWLETTIEAGTYHVVVRSTGGYGNLGAYTLSGAYEPGVVAQPQIRVVIDGVEVVNGSTLNFGTTPVGTPVKRSVAIYNTGNGDLILDPLSFEGGPPGCILISDLEKTTLAPGESVTFTVELEATTAGEVNGQLQIVTNDSEVGAFALSLTGTVVDPPPPPEAVIKVVDNGNAGFHKTGKWHLLKNKGGYEKDVHFANKINKKDKHPATAIWTFTDLEPGEYRVSVTWTKSPAHASNAPFTICADGGVIANVAVNQKKLPGDFHWGGRPWHDLGTVSIQGNRIVVKLVNRANAKVVADAVRIERVATISNAALPELAAAPSGAVITLSAGMWLGDNMRDEPHLASSPSDDRADDYWHALASAALSASPAMPAGQLWDQHADVLPELSLLGQADSLLDDLALVLATQSDDGLANL